MSNAPKKIAFFVTEDWFFVSHRLKLGRACRERNWHVVVAARASDAAERIRNEGIEPRPIRLRRGSVNPINELVTLFDVFWTMWRVRPDIVHLVGLKLILYGSIASMFFPRMVVVNAVSGLGTLFTTGGSTSRALLRRFVLFVLGHLIRRKHSWVIVQNRDDEAMFSGVAPSGQTVWIPGVGVDINAFRPTSEPEGPVVAALVGRMLAEKGVREAVEAARILRERGLDLVVRLIGSPDPENPSSISVQTLRQWVDDGLVEWAGHQSDIPGVWRDAHIALLPSYREGFPKALIEGMACGRSAVTSDAIGCREVIEDGVSGFIVPLYDAEVMADRLEQLGRDADLRERMGQAARRRVETLYADTEIAEQTLAVYDAALASTTG